VSRDRRQRSKQKLRRRADGDSVGGLAREDVPGALDHASGDVDEFDAALVRGAGGTPAQEGEAERAEQLAEQQEQALATGTAEEQRSSGRRDGNGSVGNAEEDAERLPAPREQAKPPAAPRGSLPSRAVAFLRASWAELQRVQWPDRPEVFQATAVVLGFVLVMGVYLGVADWVAQKIVNFIL
jgi:preprotein translocase subunit SecE